MEKIKEFELYLTIDKSYSKNTISSYLNNISIFFKFCNTINITPFVAEYVDLTEYLNYLKENKNYSSRSLNSMIATLKCYYKFLYLEKYIKNNPTNLLDSPKIKKTLPEYLTNDEVNKFISSIDISTDIGRRDDLLIRLLYDSGARVSELLNIKINDIDFEKRTIKLLGKGNKERLILFTNETKKILIDYIYYIYNNFEIKNNYLFSNKKGVVLGRVEVYNIIRKYCEIAGKTKHVTPHTFRHSLATHMIQNDADILTVKTILGHSKVSTTQIYTHLNKKDLKAKYDAIKERED